MNVARFPLSVRIVGLVLTLGVLYHFATMPITPSCTDSRATDLVTTVLRDKLGHPEATPPVNITQTSGWYFGSRYQCHAQTNIEGLLGNKIEQMIDYTVELTVDTNRVFVTVKGE